MEQNYKRLDLEARSVKEKELYKKYISEIHKHAQQGPHKIPMVKTNLEFWIGQKLSETILNNLTKCPWFKHGPGVDYIGTRYKLIRTYERCWMPDVYVAYNIRDKNVSSIEIKDENVYVWGVGMKSSKEEISVAMMQNGFSAVERYNSIDDIIEIVWVLGTIHVRFYEHCISISTYKLGEENILY